MELHEYRKELRALGGGRENVDDKAICTRLRALLCLRGCMISRSWHINRVPRREELKNKEDATRQLGCYFSGGVSGTLFAIRDDQEYA
jgi:hypothetical protein